MNNAGQLAGIGCSCKENRNMLKSTMDVMLMRILGIDPGIATIGFAVLESEKNHYNLIKCGVVETPAHTSLASRLSRIYDDIQELIRLFQPDAVSIEELFFNTNLTTGISVAHGRGVIILACEKAGIDIYEYTPSQVKQAVVGYGRAEKKQVMEMVRKICSLKAIPRPDDAADAVALAICHARSSTSLLYLQGENTVCSTI